MRLFAFLCHTKDFPDFPNILWHYHSIHLKDSKVYFIVKKFVYLKELTFTPYKRIQGVDLAYAFRPK